MSDQEKWSKGRFMGFWVSKEDQDIMDWVDKQASLNERNRSQTLRLIIKRAMADEGY